MDLPTDIGVDTGVDPAVNRGVVQKGVLDNWRISLVNLDATRIVGLNATLYCQEASHFIVNGLNASRREEVDIQAAPKSIPSMSFEGVLPWP